MAKSKAFFGLRQGSTKSHTFQVYRGEQITKDRVTKVANPQSTAQMEQRLKLPAVAAMASVLGGIVDHSFQSVEYGYRSVGHFRSINLQKSFLTQASYVPKGVNDPGVANFLISQGSLQTYPISFNGNSVVLTSNKDFAPKTIEGNNIEKSSANAKIIADSIGVEVGDQLTFVLQLGCTDWEKPIAGVEESSFYYSQFIIARIVTDVNDENFMKGWKFAAGVLSNGLVSITNEDEGNHLYLGTTGLPSSVTFDKELPSSWKNLAVDDEIYTLAAAAIVSRYSNNKYQRSTAYMEINDTAQPKSLWLSKDLALKTYIKSKAKSDRYLNGGDDGIVVSMEPIS